MSGEDTVASRIRSDDTLITLEETRKILGGISIATAYADPELQAIKISMTPGQRRTGMIRFILREVHALRAQRVARSESDAASVRAEVEARTERYRTRRRQRAAAGSVSR